MRAAAYDLFSTQFATIRPGTAPCARAASRPRSSRFGSFTCGTNGKIGDGDLAVFDRDAAAMPREFSRAASATNDLGPIRR